MAAITRLSVESETSEMPDNSRNDVAELGRAMQKNNKRNTCEHHDKLEPLMVVVKMLTPLDAKAVVTAKWKRSSPLDGNVSPLDAMAVVTAMWKRSSPLDGNAVVTAMCKRSSPLGSRR